MILAIDIVLLILLLSAGCSQPDFRDTRGNGYRYEDYLGKNLVINYWAIWCGPCIIETPDFVALQEEWKDRPFQIIGVSMDETGFEAVQPFVNDFMVNYPQILDEGPLADGFGGVWALPTTFLVDGDGQVQSSFLGLFPMEKRRDYLDKLVKELES